jgi:hypothetical protein
MPFREEQNACHEAQTLPFDRTLFFREHPWGRLFLSSPAVRRDIGSVYGVYNTDGAYLRAVVNLFPY